MSGYVASARKVRAAPRLARSGGVDQPFERTSAAQLAEIVVDDGAGAGGRPTLVQRCVAIRERWSQLTFYLFDPNSWR